MTNRQTPSTSTPRPRDASYPLTATVKLARAESVEPAAVELDLRDLDGRVVAPAPGDVDRKPLVHEAPHDLLSRRQAAERFGLDPSDLSRWEKDGSLTPCRMTPRGRVHYSLAELRRAVADHEPESDDQPVAAGLVLPPDRLWAMVEEARRDALHARTRASAFEAEARVLREMLERLLSEPADGSTAGRDERAAERVRQWAEQWDRHELQQQAHDQKASRGSWWPRDK
jgi:hypothetical protein